MMEMSKARETDWLSGGRGSVSKLGRDCESLDVGGLHISGGE